MGIKPVSSFIITGHSLGAGTAAVLTMMVVDHIHQLRELSNNPDFKVHCYSYAPVASVSHNLSEKYQDHIDSFVCHDDLVARLSYGTASCAKELIMDSLIAVDGLGGSSKVNNNLSIKKECFDIIQTRRKEIYHGKEPRYPLLYVPGRVYNFRRSNKQASSKVPAQDIKLPGTNPGSEPQEPQTPPVKQRPRASSLLAAVDGKRRPSMTPPPAFLPSQSEPVLKPQQRQYEPEFTLHPSSSLISEEVLISKTCLEDHSIYTYLTAFQGVREDCMRQDAQRRRAQQAQHAAATTNKSTSSFSTSSSSTLRHSTTEADSIPSPIKLVGVGFSTKVPFIKVDYVEEEEEEEGTTA